jgi:hypothetical protein
MWQKSDSQGREGLRFRFAMNYATLDSSAKTRYERFLRAYDLYKIRSEVVHGGASFNGQLQLGSVKLAVGNIADEARQMLRETINFFLRLPDIPIGKNKRGEFLRNFWQRGYFGLR